MAKATVTHVTKDELSDALAVEKQTSKHETKVNVEPNENRRSLYSTEFIKKLKREEIEKFFTPFGLIGFAKIPNDQEPKFVIVQCKDFQVAFSDYSQVFDFNIPEHVKQTPSTFKLEELAEYCMITGTTPEQAISELMVTKLFGERFNEAYFENWNRSKQKESKIAFSKMSEPMQKMFNNFQEKTAQGFESTRNKLYYGEYNASFPTNFYEGIH